jgi:hypothetical protein
MLREITGVADEPPARRRWFHDDYFDLFVWETAEGELSVFQLCYGIDSSERAIVWHRSGGFFHDGIAAGTRCDRDTLEALIRRFTQAAPTVPRMIRRTVESALQQYAKQADATQPRRRKFRRATWQRRIGAGERTAG